MGDVDELLCLGDCVSHIRFSNEVISILRDRGARVVLGNHDTEYLTHVAGGPSQKGVADDALVDWLRGQPERIEMQVAGKTLLMVHATPWSYDYVYPRSPQMKRFAEVEADFVLGGHTHTPFAGRIGRPLVINPGSAGHGRCVVHRRWPTKKLTPTRGSRQTLPLPTDHRWMIWHASLPFRFDGIFK